MDEAIRSAKDLAIVLIETPANPTIMMTDIRHAADAVAHVNPKPLVMVDNTLLGPAFQHPLMLGADLVSIRRPSIISGLSDLIAGAAIAADPELIRQMRSKRNLFGNILQPDECWMLEGRLPTVMLRMNRSSKNAERIAMRLAKHPKIARVLYPTLFTDPKSKSRSRANQCDFPGGMLSIELRGRQESCVRVSPQSAYRAQRRLARRRGDTGVPSQNDHTFRFHRRGVRRGRRNGWPGAHVDRNRRLARSC